MDDASRDRVASIPWVARLLNDPNLTLTRTGSRLPKASGEDSFFAETLATDRTIRTCVTLRTTEETDDEQPYKEIVTIVEIGDGLNGFPQVIHGGMAATLLDEVCGVLIVLNTERVVQRAKAFGSADQSLNASYMTACMFDLDSEGRGQTNKRQISTRRTRDLLRHLARFCALRRLNDKKGESYTFAPRSKTVLGQFTPLARLCSSR